MVNSGATLVGGQKKVLEGLYGVGSYINDSHHNSWEKELIEKSCLAGYSE